MKAHLITCLAAAGMIAAVGCSEDKVTGPGTYTGTEMIIVSINDSVNNVLTDRLQKIAFTDSVAGEPTYLLDSARLQTSPRAGKVAYLLERPGDIFTIYSADIDGKNLVQVATTNSLARAISYPSLSRDGKRLVYSTHDNRLIIQNVDGSAAQVIATDADYEGIADFSPDGSRLAYYNFDNKLCVVNVDGSNQRTLVTGVQNDFEGRSKLEWSPNGTKIVYVGKNEGGQVDIYSVNADGDPKPARLTDDVYGDADPTWSPDGTRIAWSSFPGDIYVMNADGTGRKNLTATLGFVDEAPSWSPRGNEILFTDHHSSQVVGLLKVYNFSTEESRTVAFKAYRGFWGKF